MTVLVSFMFAENHEIPLQKRDSNTHSTGHPQRQPTYIPTVSIDGNTLLFDSTCLCNMVTILDENETVMLTTIISADLTVELPYLNDGTYELQLQRGSITFQGFFQIGD